MIYMTRNLQTFSSNKSDKADTNYSIKDTVAFYKKCGGS